MTNNRRTVSMPESWRGPVDDFLDFKRAGGVSEQTIRSRWYKLQRLANTVDVAPSEVTTRQLIAYLAKCKAAETRKAYRNTFSTFFKWCQDFGIRQDNPAAALPSVKRPQPHPKPCPDSAIRDALRKANHAERLMILLAAECGLRRGEICQVHTNDVVTGARGEFTLIVHGKGDKQRNVPLPKGLAREILLAHGYLFKGRWGGHVEESYVSSHVSKLLPRGYSCHKLRHRFATVAYSDSHDLLAVSRALGHSSTETTECYVALPDGALRELVTAATIDQPPTATARETDQPPTATARETDQPPTATARGTDQPPYPKRLEGIDAETLRAAGILAHQLRVDAAGKGNMSFSINLLRFSDCFGDGPERLPVPDLHEGARLLQRDGLIDLAMTDDTHLCGNLTAGYAQFWKTADEYCTAFIEKNG